MKRKHSTGKGDRYRPVDQEKWDRGWAIAFPHHKERIGMNTFQEFETHVNNHWRGSPVVDEGLYLACAVNGEAGELAEHVKKMYRDDDCFLSEDRKVAILKEIGDILFYLSRTATWVGSTLTFAAEMNQNKLNSRRARGVVGGSGDNR